MIKHITEYPTYRPSGLTWLGQVPEHWHVHRLKQLIKGKLTYGANAAAEFTNPNWPRYIRITDFRTDGTLREETFRSLPPSVASKYMVEPGDLLFARSGATVGKAFIVRSSISACHAGYLIRARPNPKLMLSEFLFAFVQSSAFSAWRDSTFNTATIENIGADKYSNLSVPVPDIEGQAAIVRFLAWADHKFDRTIRAKKRIISLLNEQKQAMIQRAVISGPDSSVPLKASGLSWLGAIPAHWDVIRSKYLFREVDARSTTGMETHLSMSQRYGLVPSHQLQEKRLVSESYRGAKLCEKDDLVLNRLKAHLGVFALARENGLVSPDYTVLRAVRPIEPTYFEALYRTPAYRVELRRRAKGIVQGFWRLYTDDFYDIRVPVPPLHEQERIMAQLNSDLLALNKTIGLREEEITLMREFRARLIADVVTGKLDVREASAQLPEETSVEQVDEEIEPDNDDESAGEAAVA